MCFNRHQKQVLNMRPVRKPPQVTERAGGFEVTGWPPGAPARPAGGRRRDRDQCRASGRKLLTEPFARHCTAAHGRTVVTLFHVLHRFAAGRSWPQKPGAASRHASPGGRGCCADGELGVLGRPPGSMGRRRRRGGTSPQRSPHVANPHLVTADTRAGYFPLLN